jgi:hypothetical protein
MLLPSQQRVRGRRFWHVRNYRAGDDQIAFLAFIAVCFVSPWRDRRYRAGRSRDWVKVKNPQHPLIERVKEAFS